ncbi:hypothetical protein IHE33_15625 (plasmid) [Mycetohabitans endofungorum]
MAQASADHGVTAPTVRKWLSVAISPAGVAVLTEASSRPARVPRAIAPATAWRVLALR